MTTTQSQRWKGTPFPFTVRGIRKLTTPTSTQSKRWKGTPFPFRVGGTRKLTTPTITRYTTCCACGAVVSPQKKKDPSPMESVPQWRQPSAPRMSTTSLTRTPAASPASRWTWTPIASSTRWSSAMVTSRITFTAT